MQKVQKGHNFDLYKLPLEQFNQILLILLMKCCFSFIVSSLRDFRVLFLRTLLHTVLSDLEVLSTAGVRFDVAGPVLFPGGDSVRPSFNLLLSGGVSDGGLVRCDSLHPMARVAGLLAHPV